MRAKCQQRRKFREFGVGFIGSFNRVAADKCNLRSLFLPKIILLAAPAM